MVGHGFVMVIIVLKHGLTAKGFITKEPMRGNLRDLTVLLEWGLKCFNTSFMKAALSLTYRNSPPDEKTQKPEYCQPL